MIKCMNDKIGKCKFYSNINELNLYTTTLHDIDRNILTSIYPYLVLFCKYVVGGLKLFREIITGLNLSVINEVSRQSPNQQARRPSLLAMHHLNDHSDCKAKVLSDFCKIDFEAVKQKVLDNEKKRLVTYKAFSDGSITNNNVGSFNAKVHEEQFTEEEVKKILIAKGQEEGRGIKRMADAVFGVEEVFNMKRHYQTTEGEVTIPRSHVDEILGMEAALDKFPEFYKDDDSEPEDEEEDTPLMPDEY